MLLRAQEKVSLFRDRREAGRMLARRLQPYSQRDDTLVLALTPSGVPVGFEVARALDLLLDVFLVRKLGVPSHPEVTMGAIASGGISVRNDVVIGAFAISDRTWERAVAEARGELERSELLYRGRRRPRDLARKTLLLVDGGITTGATIRAAIAALNYVAIDRLVVAVPVASAALAGALRHEVDEFICLHELPHLDAVADWYFDFSPVPDQQVIWYLEQAQPSAIRVG